MKREISDKQKELHKKSVYLKNMNIYKLSFEKQQEIQKEQDEAYNKYHFLKRLNNAMAKRSE